MKNEKKLRIIEFFALFFVFIFPMYLSQDVSIDPSIFSNARFNITYIVTTLPQIGLIMYIMYIGRPKEEDFARVMAGYGFTDFDKSLIWKTGIAFFGTFLLAFCVSFLALIPAIRSSEIFRTVPWELSNTRILPLIFLTCLTTGYREELLFRSYLITRFGEFGLPPVAAVVISSVVFAGGHIYQGLLAFFGTFCIGMFLGVLYLRFKNTHMIALGHGFYNFFSLILFPFISNFLI